MCTNQIAKKKKRKEYLRKKSSKLYSTLTFIGVIFFLTCLSFPRVSAQTSPFKEPEEVEAQDEENDAKLLGDVVSSIKQWQKHKKEKERTSKSHRQRRDEEVVCYGDLGCFRDEGPFNYLDMLPSPPEEIGTKIFLYTRRNREAPQLLRYNNITSVLESNFNASCPVKFIVHGFGSSCSKVWPREMRLSFLAVEDCNVICVDWANGAVDPNYVRAAVNTRLVGKIIALFIKMINKELAYINDRIHLIGFSLGAHVAGFAGSELTNLSRITGLDPAGPLFEGYDGRVRLDKTDANYVDVIHSNGDSLIIGGLGAWEPIGHVDFYPNGGRAQRGCQNLLIGGLYDFIYSYSNSNNNETYRYLCNHRRAYKLFTNSISPKCQFTAFPCESYEVFETGACFSCNTNIGECGQLGYYSDQSPGRGSLYLLTRDEEPFCATQYKVNVYFTSTRVPIQTYGRIMLLLIDQNGLNETHALTQDVDDLLTSMGQIEKLIVVHPAIEPVEAQILYIAYDGWIYSGRQQWSIDKLVLTNSFGSKKSFCKEKGQILPSGIPVKLKLRDRDCLASSLIGPPHLGLIKPVEKHKIPHHGYTHYATIPSGQRKPLPPQITLKPHKPNFKQAPQHKHKIHIHPKKSYVKTSSQDVYHITNGASLTDEIKDNRPNPSHYGGVHPKWKHRHPPPPPVQVYSANKSERLPPPPPPPFSKVPTLNNGVDVEYGPKLPIPPPTKFLPGRGRPSSSSPSSSQTENIMSDDQVSVFQLGGPRANESGLPKIQEGQQKDPNYNYLILHKLPNGGAVNLENLETYSVDDLENGRVKIDNDDEKRDEIGDDIVFDMDVPRSVNDESNTNNNNNNFYPSSYKNEDSYLLSEGNDELEVRARSAPITTTSEVPTASSGSNSLKLDSLKKLSDLAVLTLTEGDPLATEARQRENSGKELNVQLLPPRLSVVLSSHNRHQAHRNLKVPYHPRARPPLRTSFRQNKVAPIFKSDPQYGPLHHRNPHHHHQGRSVASNNRRGYARRMNFYSNIPFQSQILPLNSGYKYIPLHDSQNKLWWMEELNETSSLPPFLTTTSPTTTVGDETLGGGTLLTYSETEPYDIKPTLSSTNQ